MRIVLTLAIVLAMVGCGSGGGDTPGPTDPTGVAMSNTAAEDAINNAPPERRERIRAMREKSMNEAGAPPGQKK